MLRKALVILDLQNEFISPAGRCQITNTEVVEAIKNFATIFREQPNADVIWVRSEFKKERNANDPRNDELIICDSEEEGNTTQKQGDSRQKGNPQKGKGPSQSSRNPPQSSEKKNSTEAFLSSGEDPLCAKSTPGAEFHESIVSETQNPKDRVIVKTWYSAFKETNLERFLRGRFVCELYICGLKTNISVLATASDAVKLGLNVWVMSDCLGFTSLKLHETAMAEMVGVLGVETLKSMILIRSLAAKRKTKATPVRPASKEVSKEDLEKMLENLAIEKNARQEGDEDSLEGDVSGNDEDGTEGLQQPLLPPSPPPQEVKPQSSLLQTELVERPRSRPDKPIQQPSPIESTTVKDPEDDRTEIHAEEKPISPTTSTTTSYPRPQKQPVSRIKGLRASPTPILGEGDRIGEGDSKLIANILPKELAEDVFERLKKEVRWRTMYHRGGEVPRLVAVEGEGDGDERYFSSSIAEYYL